MENNKRFYNWLFTINNPTGADWSTIRNPDWCKYTMYQLELGENCTSHIQGYVELKTAKSLKGVKKILPTAHWEERRGTQEQAIKYCSKKETRVDGPFEQGEKKEQGRRTDLEQIATDIIVEGKTISEIAKEYPVPYIRYCKGLIALKQEFMMERSTTPDVWWVWGATGAGKSKWASEQKGTLYWKPLPGKWWDGYTQQDVIILDDLRKDCFKFHELLRLLDKYPLRAETKGGWVNINSPKIVITSCFKPTDFYEGREDINQLIRRIKVTLFLERI